MFFTAQASTLLQKYTGSSHGNGTMVEKELDLGTLVIVDDREDDAMDTMKSEGGREGGREGSLLHAVMMG